MDSCSNRRWSLWDMVANLRMSGVVTLLEEISLLVKLASHNREIEAQVGIAAMRSDAKGEEAVRGSAEAVGFVVGATKSLQELVKSGHVEFAAGRLEAWAKGEGQSWAELFHRACALREAIRIEFKEHLIYAYPKPKGHKLNAWEDEWQKINAAFPDVRVDSFCATDCYALGHNTASVFHSMRVAEIGLRALGKERRVKLSRDKAIEWGTWQEILKALENEIKVIGQTWKAGKRKDDALEFYSGARADLNGFKDEYRNLVMHVRLEQYDEFQALRALTRVHEFMSRLATKLDHKHHRIKWGR